MMVGGWWVVVVVMMMMMMMMMMVLVVVIIKMVKYQGGVHGPINTILGKSSFECDSHTR